MKEPDAREIQGEFVRQFSADPLIVRSPGRINLIGEHTDYNDGFVMPAAIDKVICFAFAKNNTNTSRVIALDLNDEFEIDVTAEVKLDDNDWTNYIRGVINQLKINGFQ